MTDLPFRLGLTGSIAMGKSTTAKMFADQGVPVWDADAAVGRLYSKGGGAASALASVVPTAVRDGEVNRDILKSLLKEDASLLTRIEEIVHPMVRDDRNMFLAETAADIVLLDIPLLFETGGEKDCDAVVVVSAPADVQFDRVMARPGMTKELLRTIRERQLPDAEKRARADYVIDTSQGLRSAEEQVVQTLLKIRESIDA